MNVYEEQEKLLEALKTKKLVLFGASECALNTIKECSNFFLEHKIAYFCDNNKQKEGTLFRNTIIQLPERLVEEKDSVVILITSVHEAEIRQQLKNLYIVEDVYSHHLLRDSDKIIKESSQIDDEKTMEVYNLLQDERSRYVYQQILKNRKHKKLTFPLDIIDTDQYFVDDIFKYSKEEVFVDAGVLDGYTSFEFIKKVHAQFKRIYAFEPDGISCNKLAQILKSQEKEIYEKIILIPKGLYDCNGVLKFHTLGNGFSFINEDGNTQIPVTKLDDCVSEQITFIKMDIEGAEKCALLGAKEIIQRDKPKLAICIYHNVADLWEIPLLIKEFVPEYKFYIRHHTNLFYETVLYATIE